MTSTLTARRSGGLIEALRFPLRLRVVGGAAAPSDTFRAWAWEDHHRSFMGPWATVVIAYICLLLRDMQGVLQAITISMMGVTAFSLAAISFNLVPFIKRENQHKWVVLPQTPIKENARFSVLTISLE
ncbi:hypothetical protein DUNSADRAFT_10731 [Dunaliella salina]|uniref:Uncharacterized protein n=1 Tax=Dunaliella salina TaxID=3046 RepID=A0ABQ7GEP9_DUNSA|nr:hypothetical protein DUNSADRAFT_10731 [Dunaliella salina]|eukprot:KAF5833067.1 hypothetical protein DUNSADRAFT_10731 [Dunaliella salina]